MAFQKRTLSTTSTRNGDKNQTNWNEMCLDCFKPWMLIFLWISFILARYICVHLFSDKVARFLFLYFFNLFLTLEDHSCLGDETHMLINYSQYLCSSIKLRKFPNLLWDKWSKIVVFLPQGARVQNTAKNLGVRDRTPQSVPR